MLGADLDVADLFVVLLFLVFSWRLREAVLVVRDEREKEVEVEVEVG